MRKENQGIRDAGQSSLPRKGPSPRPGNLAGYRKGSSGMPANLARYPAFSLFIFRFSLSRVGAYCIRPTNDPAGAILSIYRSPHLSLRDIYGAYSIRPYPTGRKKAGCAVGFFLCVPDPFVVRSSFFVPYGYSSGRWMSGLPLSPPPSFGFLG